MWKVNQMAKLQILWVSKTYAAPGAAVKMHQHPYYHMFHICCGSIRFTAGPQEYLLKAGQSILVPQGVDHGYINEENLTMEDYEIKFQVTPGTQDGSSQLDVIVTSNPLVGQLMEQILQEYADFGSRADDAASSYMTAILKLLTKQKRYQKTRSFQYVDADAYSPLVQQVIHYLEKNYAQEILLDNLAAELDYHKSYLCVAFKRETQMTIVDCLNMIRIRRAVELIAGSDQSLLQIAAMCGFSSDTHFTRTFSKYVGVTPGHFRKIHQGAWIYEPKGSFPTGERPNQFIYNVLAQKQITREMLLSMEKKEAE